MAITALPTPPSRSDPTNFSERADTFLNALPLFQSEANALQNDVNAKQVSASASASAASASAIEASTSASNAATSAANALTNANSAALATNAPLWVSGTNYAAGFAVYSAVNGSVYRRVIAGAGTIDPSADGTNWKAIVLDVQTNLPTIRPTLNLDFANSKTLDPRITFVRATTARFYDGKTFAKAEENLLTYSQEFDNAAWTKGGVGITANATTAPDGTEMADAVVCSGLSEQHRISAIASALAGGRVFSIYAKADTATFLQLSFDTDAAPWANFDLSVGTVGSQGSNQTAAISAAGSGWYRLTVYTNSSTATNAYISVVDSSSAARQSSNSLSTQLFLWGAQLEQRSTETAYTPTTTAPITRYQPVLMTAPANAARFDHDPVTRESLGLLIEESRTNMALQSQTFSNASWSKSGCTVADNTMVAPDGALTATTVTTSSTNDSITQSVLSMVSGTTYSFSAYVKAGTASEIAVVFINTNGVFPATQVTASLTTGTVAIVQGTPIGYGIAPVGNGWFRVWVAATAVASAAGQVRIVSASAVATDTYYVWGAQLEAGAFPTSYIPTTAAAVTRNADDAKMDGVNFSSWYRPGEGSLFVEVQSRGAPSTHAVRLSLSQSDYALSMNNLTTPSASASTRYKGGTTYSATSAAVLALGVPFKSCASYGQGQIAVSANGGAVVSTSTPSQFSSAESLKFSVLVSSSTTIGGAACYRKVAFYPASLPNATLQAITAI